MTPYNERSPDRQYRKLLRRVLRYGEVADVTPQGVGAITLMAPGSMRFKLADGFPMITERKISGFWRQSLGEIFAFANGARTLEALEAFGCKFWTPWGTKKKCEKRGLAEGDLGPGSYGGAFANFPTVEGEPFNQFEYIIRQIKERPELRTHFISPWIPQYTVRVQGRQQKVVVCPCHGWIHIRIVNGKLTLHMFQRSGDVVIGVPSNMVQYAGLTLALAQVLGYEPYEYIHTISDAHVYQDQLYAARKMLRRQARPLPTVVINDAGIRDIFSFRAEHFTLSDYEPHPAIPDIPVGI